MPERTSTTTTNPKSESSGAIEKRDQGAEYAQARDRVRKRWALGLNVVAPGVGLIILRREWFGLTLATLFFILAQAGVYGLLYHGSEISPLMARIAAVAALIVWGFSQWVAWSRARTVLGPGARRNVSILLEQAEAAVAERRYADAVDLLRVAIEINDEELSVRLALARLLTMMGHFDKARSEWAKVLDLDASGELRSEAITALARLPEA